MSAGSNHNLNNPNNDAYWQARGLAQRPDNWEARVRKAERRKINKAKKRAWSELSSRIAKAKAAAKAQDRQAAQEKAARDNRANQLNPQHKPSANNRANQLNPNHPAYHASRKKHCWRGGRLTAGK